MPIFTPHRKRVTAILYCISDWNKTKMLRSRPRPRPRPVKQQQQWTTEKNSSVATRMFVIKNNSVQKTSKNYDMHILAPFLHALITRKNTGAYYISALSCRTASCHAQQCWKQDQKYKTKTKTKTKVIWPRPRPRPVWDRSLRPVLS